ncbi:MAG: hypothetical protein KA319_10965 [Ferruginibacter sp.]|nr:hypothetical protein [Ferruginibacter sp.]
MPTKSFIIIVSLLSVACNNTNSAGQTIKTNAQSSNSITENPFETIQDIPLPQGFARTKQKENSYAYYLQHLKLKKDKTVYTFNGSIKQNQSAQFAVVDITVGYKDLQQCADAVMRLRAEYLFAQKRFTEIDFIDNNRKHYNFTPPYTQTHFENYLQQVFGMCGSASLAKQLKPVDVFANMQIGDVIIKGGFPGHAVHVIDMAQNNNGEKIYLLAQSYMPAQNIHVLVNNNDDDLSPWYNVNSNNEIITPEYSFVKNDLKRW